MHLRNSSNCSGVYSWVDVFFLIVPEAILLTIPFKNKSLVIHRKTLQSFPIFAVDDLLSFVKHHLNQWLTENHVFCQTKFSYPYNASSCPPAPIILPHRFASLITWSSHDRHSNCYILNFFLKISDNNCHQKSANGNQETLQTFLIFTIDDLLISVKHQQNQWLAKIDRKTKRRFSYPYNASLSPL